MFSNRKRIVSSNIIEFSTSLNFNSLRNLRSLIECRNKIPSFRKTFRSFHGTNFGFAFHPKKFQLPSIHTPVRTKRICPTFTASSFASFCISFGTSRRAETAHPVQAHSRIDLQVYYDRGTRDCNRCNKLILSSYLDNSLPIDPCSIDVRIGSDYMQPLDRICWNIGGAFHQYEKARLVAKLRAGRRRKKEHAGKCEGRKSWAEVNPDLVREAKRLRRRSPKGHQRSLRSVAAELARLGYVNERGVQFSPSSVRSMLG
jgi:hypothetical protein